MRKCFTNANRPTCWRAVAEELGAKWVGGAFEAPPMKLDAAIIFAPAGEIVPIALSALDRDGRLVLGGIHNPSAVIGINSGVNLVEVINSFNGFPPGYLGKYPAMLQHDGVNDSHAYDVFELFQFTKN